MEQAKTTERCADRLRRNGFEVATAADAHEAGEYIRSRIAELAPASISFGDSMTLYATGTVEWLRTQRTYPFIDTFEQGVPFRELIERRRQALLCDLFLTGANAVTLDGEAALAGHDRQPHRSDSLRTAARHPDRRSEQNRGGRRCRLQAYP